MQEKRWKKLGLIYNVDNNHEKLLTHSSNPLAVHLQDDVYRIYYSGQDRDWETLL